MGEAIAFYFISACILGFAVLVISTKDTVHSVLFLVLDFLFVAALYVLLGAAFLAAIQILVYAGGIVVLYLFVVMLVNLKRPPEAHSDPHRQTKWGFALSVAVLVELAAVAGYSVASPAPPLAAAVAAAPSIPVSRNIIIIFMSIELILNAVNINLIAFSAQLQNAVGQVFAIFVIAVAAAEAAVGLGIILAFYRNKETVNIDEMNLMRW